MLIQSSKAGFNPGFVPNQAEERLSPREVEPQKKALSACGIENLA